jgi:serine protease AprX
MKQFSVLVVCLSLLAVFPASGNTSGTWALDWSAKVDPWVLETAAQGQTEFLVYLNEQADLGGASLLSTKLEKGTFVYQQLSETAARTQKSLLAYLNSRGIEHRAFWVANMIWVRADQKTVQDLAMRQDVARLSANPAVNQQLPLIQPGPQTTLQTTGIEWNLIKVRAPDVWSAGFTGQGVVIGGQDTGYQWDHPALKGKYRGWNGLTADHNYSWHDAIHPPSSGGICGPDSPAPCDDNSHGTHTMGIMVGDDGFGNQIGMAPGAKWIGCRNMDQGVGTPATYAECYQWFIAPTDMSGNNPRPDLAPDVINNSWSCPPSEGCTDPNVLLNVVDNVRQAGILTVQAASNQGPSCGTVDSPAAIYDASFSVGATDINDTIASFSSRGPVSVDGSFRLKPDVSAPGVSIRSSFPTNRGTYGFSSGTSMASPHVAGLAALIISSDPALAGNVDQIEKLISHNALPRTTSANCGDIPGSQIPNNTYGWGRIDSWKAVMNFDLQLHTSPSLIKPGELITYTLQITQRYPGQTTNVRVSDGLPLNTSFVSATQPYTILSNFIQWDISFLEYGNTRSFQLVVQAPLNGAWLIVNQAASVTSDQTTSSPLVDPSLVFVADYLYFFPFVPKR